MSNPAPSEKLKGTIEVDETYVGGKPRPRQYDRGHHHKRGRGTSKTMVVAMVQRGGDLRYTSVGRVTAKQIAAAIRENVDLSSRLMTDENLAYRKVGKEFEGGHGTTRHGMREYAKPGGIHSNTIESALSLLKRGVYGTFHSISKQHLHRYCDEFAFRWNHRFVDDGQRVEAAIRATQGKRLVYRDSRGGAA
jgi:transposase